jgi:dynactin-4
MAALPYTRYACPCSETTSAAPASLLNKKTSQHIQNEAPGEEEEDEGGAFHPHDMRANFSLYPLDQLLFCDECNHTRCAKCWSEETLYWYCPSCLFEVPSSGVKGDGNR